MSQLLSKYFSDSPETKLYKGTTLIYPGETFKYAYYITEGFIQVSKGTGNLHKYNPLIFKPGEVFPLNNWSRYPTVYSFTSLTDAIYQTIPIDQFIVLTESNSEIIKEMYEMVGNIFDRVMDRADQLSIGDAFTKVLSRLHSIAKHFGSTEEGYLLIPFPLTHVNLASSIGIARETTSINIKLLEKRGYIKYHGRTILVNKEKTYNYLKEQGIEI